MGQYKRDARLKRVRAEFLGIPGLRLTCEQARRLCGVEQAPCLEVMGKLADTRFLCVTPTVQTADHRWGRESLTHPGTRARHDSENAATRIALEREPTA
jgi:hypothetical protein